MANGLWDPVLSLSAAGYGTISKASGVDASSSGAAEPRSGAKKVVANLKNDKHDALMAEFKRAHMKVRCSGLGFK